MSKLDPADILAVLLRSDLSSFIQRSFATVDPSTEYKHNWHIDAIACQLERVARGETRRLVITMPPRSLKSISASIAFVAWILENAFLPSYFEALAEKPAYDCMKVLKSDWY